MIEFINVKKRFGNREVLNGVSFKIEKGEIFFIIGQSGVGKSVLIKHIVGLLKVDSGRILLDGQDITNLTEEEFYPIRLKCAMVFQHSTLFDSMTVIDNVSLPLRKHKRMNTKEAREYALSFLKEVGMEEYAFNYPQSLGDGLRKRVAIARALTIEPQYILFDEPTTGLDPVNGRRIDHLIKELSRRRRVTCVVVSHDLDSIFSIADRIAMLYKGKIRLLGTPQDFKKSEDPVVKQFINGVAEGPMEEV